MKEYIEKEIMYTEKLLLNSSFMFVSEDQLLNKLLTLKKLLEYYKDEKNNTDTLV
jgi:hypothetical protein